MRDGSGHNARTDRAAQPEEIVGAALLLCSDAASFITGADVQVTGGGRLR
jgi:NAD(P)-dependent dehydrogenase (short-subunit alcohol dehydrogenase family)